LDQHDKPAAQPLRTQPHFASSTLRKFEKEIKIEKIQKERKSKNAKKEQKSKNVQKKNKNRKPKKNRPHRGLLLFFKK
jgi:hypothetical protein